MPIVDLPAEDEMAAAVSCIDAWVERELSSGGLLVAAERQEVTDRTASQRWYLRFKGEEKDFITLWLTLRQRTLHHEVCEDEREAGHGCCAEREMARHSGRRQPLH